MTALLRPPVRAQSARHSTDDPSIGTVPARRVAQDVPVGVDRGNKASTNRGRESRTPPNILFGLDSRHRSFLRSRIRWLILVLRLCQNHCSLIVTMREHAFVTTLAITFSIVHACGIVDVWTFRMRLFALALEVELAHTFRIGG